eukprot:scaffold2549_cov333-Pavlova_lutheri.AAC.6
MGAGERKRHRLMQIEANVLRVDAWTTVAYGRKTGQLMRTVEREKQQNKGTSISRKATKTGSCARGTRSATQSDCENHGDPKKRNCLQQGFWARNSAAWMHCRRRSTSSPASSSPRMASDSLSVSVPSGSCSNTTVQRRREWPRCGAGDVGEVRGRTVAGREALSKPSLSFSLRWGDPTMSPRLGSPPYTENRHGPEG